MMRCCFKGCDREGEPSEGFDFYACEECCEELELAISELYEKDRREQYARHSNN